MPTWARSWLAPAAWVAGVSAVLLVALPGRLPQLRHDLRPGLGTGTGARDEPGLGSALPPTPHPLTELLGAGRRAARRRRDHGDDGHRLRRRWACSAASSTGSARSGSTAGSAPSPPSIVLTRAPFLSNGLRAYIDLPYIALCLGALLIEAKRPRAGWPVLALLALAGLLRPEAWLFAGRLPRSTWRSTSSAGPKDGKPARRASESCRERRHRPGEAWSSLACLAARRPGPLGRCSTDHHRQPALLVDRDPGDGRDARTPDRAGRPRPLRAAAARRGAAVAGDGRRRSAASCSASPSCAAARRSASSPPSSPCSPSPCSPAAGLAIIPRYTMLAAAILAIFVAARAARLAPARAAATPGAGAGRSSPAWWR